VARSVVVTGIGLVTPLGQSAGEVLDRMAQGEAAAVNIPFDSGSLACPLYAPVGGFDPEKYFPDNKTLRLMNRDAQMAVVAAHFAMQDACIKTDETYPSEHVALYGSTGVSSMSVEEMSRIIKYAAANDGSLDLHRFGQVALKRVRPVLSFRILANMPICFVSIFENIRGQNSVYTPWEGQGAQAVAAGIRAIKRGETPCALVGGCDVKTRELSLINLQQLGAFESWKRYGKGCVPGEGAAFLVLEDEEKAAARGKRPYARIADYVMRSVCGNHDLKHTLSSVISGLKISGKATVIAAGDGDIGIEEDEKQAFEYADLDVKDFLRPKLHLGNLFAAAAPVQIALAAELVGRKENGQPVAADCFGFGSEQASFVLEAPCRE
jgi:3-oxoacyl-[acyl-carrier-protein] synthase II